MATMRERILRLLEQGDGLTDREITDQLVGHDEGQQYTNQICHRLAAQNIIVRKERYDGLIGNYLIKRRKFTTRHNQQEAVKENSISSKSLSSSHPENSEGTLKKLIASGFENVGRWFWVDDDLDFELSQHAREKNILYAFVVDGKVKYIGKSIQTLQKRIYLYKNCGPSQRTNIRIRGKIRDCLKNGSQVLIYAFVQKMPLMYQDIPINLAAGLEDNLIAALKPDWNLR